MQYITTADAAKKWQITTSRVTMLAKNGQIQGAIKVGHQWMIPQNAEKPADGRTKTTKTDRESDEFYRFPLYLDYAEESFSPPLSAEELLLYKAEKAFYACRFEEAKEIIIPLSESAKNRYVYMGALYLRCNLNVYFQIENNFARLYDQFRQETEKDLPHKREMELLRYCFEYDYGYYNGIYQEFVIDPEYTYDPFAMDIALLLSFICMVKGEIPMLSKLRYDMLELICSRLEREGHFFLAQQLHYALLVVYQLKKNKEKSLYHIRKGLQIGMERELYFYPAYFASYYPQGTRIVLREFPHEFREKIMKNGEKIHQSFVRFSCSLEIPSYLGILSEEEYEFAFLATQGYTNQEVANLMKVSEKQVSKKYSVIYDKLGVRSKSELASIIDSSHRKADLK